MAKLTRNQQAYQALLTKYTKSRIAEMAGCTRQAINKWDMIPVARVSLIADKTGIRPEELLPEPYAITRRVVEDHLRVGRKKLFPHKSQPQRRPHGRTTETD